jgi:phosphoglucosamine mutase
MQEHGFNLGGEQSGHIILGDYSTTGDGLIAALKILAAINDEKNQNLKNLNNFTALPQILKNIKITKDCNLDDPKIVNIIKISEQELGVEGRILVRKSGTEPLVRIMVEGKKASEINKIANRIASEIKGVSKDTAINNPIIILKNGWKYTSNCWSGFWRRSRDSRRH